MRDKWCWMNKQICIFYGTLCISKTLNKINESKVVELESFMSLIFKNKLEKWEHVSDSENNKRLFEKYNFIKSHRSTLPIDIAGTNNSFYPSKKL